MISPQKKHKAKKTTRERDEELEEAIVTDRVRIVGRHVARIDALLDVVENKIRETPVNAPTTLDKLLRAADSLLRHRKNILEVAASFPRPREDGGNENENTHDPQWGVPANLAAHFIVEEEGDDAQKKNGGS